VILLWALRQIGLIRPFALGLAVTAIGCLTVPLVAIGTRSLCREQAARRLLPALVLAPYAIWLAVSLDAVTMAISAGAVTFGVLASEPGRKPRWAITSGVLFGIAALFGYAAGWLAPIPLIVCFLRRRGTTISFLGVGALAPILIARYMGFSWTDGLTGAQTDWSLRIGPTHSWLLWSVLDVVLLMIACGPPIVAAARRIRRTPGWPFVAGAGLAVAVAIGSGLSRGEVERSWLPFFPWLLVPLVAPDEPDGEAAKPPLLLLALGAASAVVIESVLRTRW
jgi:hypothetical protein